MSRDLLNELRQDFAGALEFLTRLPLPSSLAESRAEDSADLQRSLRLFPLIGMIIGLISGLVFWAAFALGLGAWPAALLAVAASALVTGALHEDGLSDTLDGFGGGKTSDEKLAIMRDSRLGSYGALALIVSVLLRSAALVALADPSLAMAALIGAHSASRAALPAVMVQAPLARSDGLAARVGTPEVSFAITALALGALLTLLSLGFKAGVLALAVLAMTSAAVAWLAKRQIGGITGDVLGTVQQTGEVAVLLTAVALA